MIILVIGSPAGLVLARQHEDIFCWIRLYFAFKLLGERVDDLVDLLTILHRDRQFLLLGQHRVALDEE